mmetsp:Transcript_12247/g.30885  ORF Transcript_12247/g.30885 Transcript_12247/m.30885 type:complete len:249 (+) Transcript_12247:983-1729(+)
MVAGAEHEVAADFLAHADHRHREHRHGLFGREEEVGLFLLLFLGLVGLVGARFLLGVRRVLAAHGQKVLDLEHVPAAYVGARVQHVRAQLAEPSRHNRLQRLVNHLRLLPRVEINQPERNRKEPQHHRLVHQRRRRARRRRRRRALRGGRIPRRGFFLPTADAVRQRLDQRRGKVAVNRADKDQAERERGDGDLLGPGRRVCDERDEEVHEFFAGGARVGDAEAQSGGDDGCGAACAVLGAALDVLGE